MATFERYQGLIDGIIQSAEKKAEAAEREEQRRAEAFHAMLLAFDREADRIQATILKPRVDYLAEQFSNTVTPEYKEEENYRHRIHLLFLHCQAFPCTADVTFRIVHDPEPGHYSVSFDYVILPTYVTDKYRTSTSKLFPTDGSQDAELATYVETSIAEFLTHYLKARA